MNSNVELFFGKKSNIEMSRQTFPSLNWQDPSKYIQTQSTVSPQTKKVQMAKVNAAGSFI